MCYINVKVRVFKVVTLLWKLIYVFSIVFFKYGLVSLICFIVLILIYKDMDGELFKGFVI